MAIVKITPEEMHELGGRLSADPAVAKLYELIKGEAEKQGGSVLAVWRLHLGKLWGNPYVMSPDEVARRLDLPVSEVSRRIDDVRQIVQPKWLASDEYKTSHFAED